ncbi:peptidylprolyl isomerase [Butyrivibrio sp. YAB3001]|uniref:peptidylprolyl isomerase n=1 Tax=Butyrivibrio sp. YAB3001 TaxID=1520812 RepID=UPI0008F6560C|nr:peptidylprolyl isomerase [Butyrivibrio sp. YAB3001]SFC59818.1 foldase protein PrsA [Butyrivibrio sp. YAB3001]
MKRYRKIAAWLMICAMLAANISGCGFSEDEYKIVFTTGFKHDEVFRIETSVCTIQELMTYLVNTQNGYESTFGAGIWDVQTEDSTVGARLKESVLAKVAQVKAMNLLAAQMEISLTDEEIQKADSAAAEYYATLSPQDIDAMHGATQDTIAQIYSEYALAEKLYDYIIRDINPEISDDEARTITVEQIMLKTYSLDASGEKVPYKEAAKGTVLAKMRSIKNQLIDGASFEELMDTYNEADERTLSFGKGIMPENYEKAAFNLGNGEVSSIVEIPDGYCIIKCISTFNRDETEYNKVKIVAQRKREVFGQQYDDFVATLTKELNQELWDSIEVTSYEGEKTSSLWEVFNKSFGEKR